MELKELKKFGYKEKLIYDTKVEVLEGGRRVTTETPISSYFMKIYDFENGWIEWKVCVENSEIEDLWNVRLTIQTIDGMDEEDFESPNNTDDLLVLLSEHTERCCQIKEL